MWIWISLTVLSGNNLVKYLPNISGYHLFTKNAYKSYRRFLHWFLMCSEIYLNSSKGMPSYIHYPSPGTLIPFLFPRPTLIPTSLSFIESIPIFCVLLYVSSNLFFSLIFNTTTLNSITFSCPEHYLQSDLYLILSNLPAWLCQHESSKIQIWPGHSTILNPPNISSKHWGK